MGFALSVVLLAACSGSEGAGPVATSALADASRAEIAPPRPISEDGGSDGAAPMCAPQKGTALATPWLAPRVRSNACNTQQISFLASYLTSDPDDAAMNQAYQTFTNAAANEGCFNCVFTDLSTSPRGAFVHNDKDEWANYGGCFAALANDVSAAGCGARYDALWDCEDTYCSHCEGDDAWSECAAQADATSCAALAQNAQCIGSLEEQCFGFPNETPVAFVTRFLSLFCGQ